MAQKKVCLIIEYDGTHYHGWQQQINAPTIADALEKAIAKVVQHPVRITGSGRTDTGVHALGQVATFKSDTQILLYNLQKAFNTSLPRDIVIRRIYEVPETFHPRRSATERHYRYRFYLDSAPSALDRHNSLFVPYPLDLEKMNKATSCFVGTCDFSAFRSAHCDAEHAVREIRTCELISYHPYLDLHFKGSAFLRNQIRIMASTLLEVGKGSINPEDISFIIESKDRTQAGPTLPPHGLTLMQVDYPEGSFIKPL